MKKFTLLFTILFFSIGLSANSQWVQMSNGISYIDKVFPFGTLGNNIFTAIKNHGIYITTNNGLSWAPSGLNNNVNVHCFAASGNNIFASTEYNGIYLSTNNGSSWQQTSFNYQTVYPLAVNGNSIFAGSYGVYRSTDNGSNWYLTGLTNFTRSFAVLGNKIFAGTNNDSGIFLSTNNGTNWTQTSLNNKTVISLSVSGSNIFAGTQLNGVFISTNEGIGWLQTSLNNRTVLCLVTVDNNIIAGTDSNGVYLSTNNGSSWAQKNEGYNITPSIGGLLISNNYIFAGTFDQLIWRRPLSELIGIQIISTEIPSAFSLSQNYPNPFNPTTNIRFDILKSGFTSMKIYDMLGREISTLVNQQLKPGTYEVDWDGSGFTSGVYFYKLSTESYTETRKMMLIK